MFVISEASTASTSEKPLSEDCNGSVAANEIPFQAF